MTYVPRTKVRGYSFMLFLFERCVHRLDQNSPGNCEVQEKSPGTGVIAVDEDVSACWFTRPGATVDAQGKHGEDDAWRGFA